MKQRGYYAFANPLVDPMSALHAMMEEAPEDLSEYLRLPDYSGVERPRHKMRLSDSYFKPEGEEWIPQVVDDPALPGRVLAGGRLLNWVLREECVTRLLFESGGRVSEVTGLSLGDWMARGMLQEANALSNASHGTRIKFWLSFACTLFRHEPRMIEAKQTIRKRLFAQAVIIWLSH